jgi:hypothetical protein
MRINLWSEIYRRRWYDDIKMDLKWKVCQYVDGTVLKLPRNGSDFGFCECSVRYRRDLLVCLAPGACHVLKKSASSYMLPLCTRLYEKMCPFVAEDLAKLVQGALRSALWWLSPAGTTQQAVRKSTQRRL